MMHFKKGLLTLNQDEQISKQGETKRARRHVALYNEGDEKEESKRTRKFVRGMMVMVPQKDSELV